MLSIITGPLRSRNLKVWALAACVGSVASACDKLPLLAPTGSKVTLSSNNNVVQANGTAEIRATVLEVSGTPVQNGTTVTFTTNLGGLSPTEARTLNGVATVQFVGNGQSGKAQIKAISGGAASEALEISVGAAATSRVSVAVNPTSVPTTGGTSTITATVVDVSGNPLRGVPVTFATTSGTFSSASANTDSNGAATTTLTTSREASITATAGGTTSTAVTITTTARPTVSISVASGTTPTEGGVTTFSITANPGTNGAPMQNVTVDYGDGSSDDLGTVSGTIGVQHVYRDDGSFSPRVTAQDTSGATATASTVIFVQPLLVSISATSTGLSATFTANVSPAGSSVASYSWNFGDGTSQTTSSNQVSHTYSAAGTYSVRVGARTSTGHTSSGTTSVSVP